MSTVSLKTGWQDGTGCGSKPAATLLMSRYANSGSVRCVTALCCQLLDSPAKTGKFMRQDTQCSNAAVMLSASSLPDVRFLVHESFSENLRSQGPCKAEIHMSLPYSHAAHNAVMASLNIFVFDAVGC